MNGNVDALLKRLHLANSRRGWQELTQRAEKEDWTYEEFLTRLVEEEVSYRTQTRLRRFTHKAKFPFLRTVDEFDFTHQSSLRLALMGSFLGPEFITEGRNLVLLGKAGRGKTHLAVGLAYKAIQNGFEASFTTCAALIEDVTNASSRTRLREVLSAYVHPHVLIVDEVGYLTYDENAANALYHVVNERHLKKRSMIFTSNKALKDWGKVLHDADLAEAIVDRIMERGRVLTLDGPSMRTRHLAPKELEALEELKRPAIVSGKNRPEFPEPTLGSGQSFRPFFMPHGGTPCSHARGPVDGVPFSFDRGMVCWAPARASDFICVM